MPRTQDENDLFWTEIGDIYIYEGDLKDTEDDPLRSLVQECKTRISADIGDWSIYPNIGSNISDYIGEPNTKATAEAIKVRIMAALIRGSFLSSQDISIKYIPVSHDTLLYRIAISIMPTIKNGESSFLHISMLYDFKETQVTIRF